MFKRLRLAPNLSLDYVCGECLGGDRPDGV